MAISIGRLSGGNTPADGSDPRTFPAIWNATADTLEDGIISTSLTSPSTGQLLQFDGTNWVNVGQAEAGAIPVFADSTARSSAIPTPTEGMVTYVEDLNRVEVYDGAAFGPIGGILQVVSTTKTDTFSLATTSFTTITGLTGAITPSSTTSKIMVIVSISYGTSSRATRPRLKLLRDSTPISIGDSAGSRLQITTGFMAGDTSDSGAEQNMGAGSLTFLDDPSSSSEITYGVQIASSTGTTHINRVHLDSDSTEIQYGRATSTITLMEVAV